MVVRHYERSRSIAASVAQVFEHLDDPTRLSSHMSKPSWKLGGGSMHVHVDDQEGKNIGSRIRLAGRVFGLFLNLEEEVIEREPPSRKTWRTVGTPRLVVIGNYQLGFTALPASGGSLVRVFIDYELPTRGFGRLLGLAFGDFYARWCVHQMIRDVAERFAPVSGDRQTHVGRRSAP